MEQPLDTPEEERDNSRLEKASSGKSVSQRDNQLALMLAMVTLAFVVLTLPQYVRLLVFRFVDHTNSVRSQEIFILAYHITQKLFWMNNAVNFYLYCITGSKFRKDLMKLLSSAKCNRFNNR